MSKQFLFYSDAAAGTDGTSGSFARPFVEQVAKVCAKELTIVSDLGQAVAGLNSDTAAVFLELSSSAKVREFTHAYSGQVEENRIHLILNNRSLDQIEGSFLKPCIGNLVIIRSGDAREDARHYARIIDLADKAHPFGILNLVKPTTDLHEIEFSETSQKNFASTSLIFQLQDFGCNERVAGIITGTVDELLMNAMFDAPVDDKGGQLYAHEPRSTNLPVLGEVKMSVCMEEQIVAITVLDLVGSLNRPKLIEHISRGLHGNLEMVRDKNLAGAGLGLSMVLRSGGSLSFVTSPGKKTEVTAFFRKSESVRELKSQFQFISTMSR